MEFYSTVNGLRLLLYSQHEQPDFFLSLKLPLRFAEEADRYVALIYPTMLSHD